MPNFTPSAPPPDAAGRRPDHPGAASCGHRSADTPGKHRNHPQRSAIDDDGRLMHAIADNALMGTWPCPVPADRLGQIHRARMATFPLPPPPLPTGAIRAQRKVHASGRFTINGQFIKLGPRHAGKIVTVVIEDTHFRILHGEDELAVRPRKNPGPITRLYVKGMGTQEDRQGSPDDKPSRKS